jgi:very-short-patch-repair endonuclease
VTREDVDEHLEDRERRTATRHRRLVSVRPGVMAFAGSGASWEQAVLAAVLSAGPGALASHATAAAVWRIPGFPRSAATPLEITVPRGRRPRVRGARLHTTLLLDPAHATERDLIPVTSVARTVCDLDGEIDGRRLGRLVDELLMRKATTITELQAVHRRLRRGSRPSLALARVLVDRGAEWDDADSTGEAKLVRWLIAADLPAPVQQHVVDRYRVDLAYPEFQVFIEYDGFAVHATRTNFDSDRARDNALQLSGRVVLRYTSRSTRGQVVRDVTAALRRAGWSPHSTASQ